MLTCPNFKKARSYSFDDAFWQKLETTNGTFRILNAYYDDRKFLAERNQSSVRIILVQERNVTEANLFCQIWFDQIARPMAVAIHEFRPLWYQNTLTNNTETSAVLVTCVIPWTVQGLIPTSVSVVAKQCDTPSNSMNVIHNLPENGKMKIVAVCAKFFDYKYDSSMMLIEWIEILIFLGADIIIISVITIHPNMMKILKYYEKAGKVEVIMFTLPKSKIGLYHNEMLAINDCFYKNVNKYKFVTSLDIDEFIMPTRFEDKTWQKLLTRVIMQSLASELEKFPGYNGYEVNNVYFNLDSIHTGEIQPEVPSNFLFLQHIYRAKEFSPNGAGAKSFMKTDNVILIHNHRPMQCVGGRCNIFRIPYKDARLQHYRIGCGQSISDEKCNQFRNVTVRDVSLWRFKDELIKNVYKTLNDNNMDPDRF